MSSKFLSSFNSYTSRLQRALTATTALGRPFRNDRRSYKVTSIPQYDMSAKKFADPNGDRLGCYMPTKEFEEYYGSVCKRLGIPVELDNMTNKLIQEAGGEIDDIDDIHKQVRKPTINQLVKSPITNMGGQSKDAPDTITWPAEYSDPVAFVGGLIKNTLKYSLQSEVNRNLAFADSLADLIDDKPGEFSSVLQYYVGFGAPLSFTDLNFLLEAKGQKSLTPEQLADKDTVEKYVASYLDGILPAPLRKIRVDMTAQTVRILHIQSPHSSAVLKYQLKDGTDGYVGVEVERPSYIYVDGKLVKNAEEQVVDPAVFANMNLRATKPPKTIEELDSPDLAVTRDNFYKFNPTVPIKALPDNSKPVVEAINLVDSSKEGKDSYLSSGTPCAVTTHTVVNAKALAKVMYFLTGRKPYEALRFGGYFAHKALTGQSRSCEALVIYGCDLGGIKPADLLPVLSDLKQYDLSQEMRESVYENFLFIELSQDKPDSKQADIFSAKSASDYMTLVSNAFACMQVYRDLLVTSRQKIEDAITLKKADPAAQDIHDRIEKETRNFMHRYEHMWSIASYIVLYLYRTRGVAGLQDPVDDKILTARKAFKGPQKQGSAFLEIARNLTSEKITRLKKQKADDLADKTGLQSKEVKTVQQNSLDLANKSMAKFDLIEKELNK